MTVPKYLRNVGEKLIISYDWTEIANGLGFQTYNAMTTKDSSATQYKLVEFTMDSATDFTKADSGDTDFVMGFKVPRTIEGKAVLKVHWTVSRASSGAAITGDLSAILLKNSGTLVTAVATQLSTTSIKDGNEIMEMIIPKTSFAIGDTLTLRLTTVMGAGAEGLWIFHDPLDEDKVINQYGANRTKPDTKLQIHIPFKIDL